MKRASTERPYLSWCLIVRNCEEKLPGALEACLKSLRERTPEAEIVVVDTMSSDRPQETALECGELDGDDFTLDEPMTHTIAKRYADVFDAYRGPRGDWTEEMAAFDDAAAARNRSVALAHGEILGWIDSDDTLPGPDEVARLLKINGKYAMPRGEDNQTTAPPLEDFLRRAFGPPHNATEIYCPYLFAKDDQGRAKMWQDRERFVRNDGNYCWKSPAHEVLVPDSPTFPVKRVFAPEILFVHHKKWTRGDLDFSTKRHFDIMVRGFDDGSDFNSRTAMYLGVQAGQLAPHRQDEFIQAAYDLSGPDTDRYRALQLKARRSADMGLLLDAYEQVTAAIGVRPELPEAYLTGGDIAAAAEDWARAAEWTAAASKRPVTAECAIISPRAVVFAAPCNAAYYWLRAARQLCNIPSRETWDRALELYRKASDILGDVLQKIEQDDPDRNEVICLKLAHDDERDACQHTITLRDLAIFLCANDETEKAAKVRDLLPWQFEHSAMRAALGEMSRSVVGHYGGAYEDFYRDDKVTGAIPTSDPGLDAPEDGQLGRIGWAMRQARAVAEKLGRPLRVLEVGCFDGNVGIPVMRSLPKGSTYVGIELQPSALGRFRERLAARSWTKDHEWDLREGMGTAPLKHGEVFDIAIFFEVIEHVPFPERDLAQLLAKLSGGDARLLISTPYGSFDRGHPPEKTAHGTPRDPRGHLRALTPRSLHALLRGAVRASGLVDMHSFQPMPGGLGSELVAAVQKGLRPRINFLVMGALWDWHASHVIATGIGASEETIVYLARKLAVGRAWPSVYGPVPTDRYILDEEAADGVCYWSHAHLGEMEKDAITVVSRAPAWGRQTLDGIGHRGRRILWLQDAVYPDLNDAIAASYSKVVVLSQWHKEAMHDRHGVALERMTIIPNFLLKEHFDEAAGAPKAPERRRHHFVYAASPDRGLITLLQAWPKILAAWPDATLDIFYGWTGCMRLGLTQPAWRPGFRAIRHQFEALRWQKGVRDCGRVNHAEIAMEMRSAGYWVYPCTKFEETGCLNAAKAKAAGCTVITHPIAALAETAAGPYSRLIPRWDENGGEPFETYLGRVAGAVLETDLTDAARAQQAEQAIAEYSLDAVFPKWLDLLGG